MVVSGRRGCGVGDRPRRGRLVVGVLGSKGVGLRCVKLLSWGSLGLLLQAVVMSVLSIAVMSLLLLLSHVNGNGNNGNASLELQFNDSASIVNEFPHDFVHVKSAVHLLIAATPISLMICPSTPCLFHISPMPLLLLLTLP